MREFCQPFHLQHFYILAFSKGEQPVRDDDALSRRQPLVSAALKFIAAALVSLAVAFIVTRFL